mmetsp:Transcript_17491/g.44038  ORF Transcript_17491/g.44038 Transcript_17491/m.44038 type:complete len:237 (+) Transcript_17491:3325-4035(+)
MVSVLSTLISALACSPRSPANTSILVRPTTVAVCECTGASVRAVPGLSHCIVSRLSTATSRPTPSCAGDAVRDSPPCSTSSLPPASAHSPLASRSSGTSPRSRAWPVCTSHGSSNRILSSVDAPALSVSSSIWPRALASSASRSSTPRLSALSSSLCFSIRSCCLRTASSRFSLSCSSAAASSSFCDCAAFTSRRLRISSVNRLRSASNRSTCICICLSLTSSALICSCLCSRMSA